MTPDNSHPQGKSNKLRVIERWSTPIYFYLLENHRSFLAFTFLTKSISINLLRKISNIYYAKDYEPMEVFLDQKKTQKKVVAIYRGKV